MQFQFIEYFREKIVDFISPPFCEHCKEFIRERSIFCNRCFEKIYPIVSIKIAITPEFALSVFALSDYKEPLKSLILAKNWGNGLASKQLGELIWRMTNFQFQNFDYLIPIPLHWSRFAKRGFNQSETIASVLSKKTNKPVCNILKRAKYTKFQSTLTAIERNKNVRNVFEIDFSQKVNFEGRDLILVDDLLTSGSTLKSAAKELLKLKPRSISAVVACRVI